MPQKIQGMKERKCITEPKKRKEKGVPDLIWNEEVTVEAIVTQ